MTHAPRTYLSPGAAPHLDQSGVLVYLCASFPVVPWLLLFSLHACQFIALSDVKFLYVLFPMCFGCPSHYSLRLLPSTHTTCSYHFNVFSIFQNCFTAIFFPSIHFVLLSACKSLQPFSKNSFLFLAIFNS